MPTLPAAEQSWTAAHVVDELRSFFCPSAGPSVGEWTLLTEVPALGVAAPTAAPAPHDAESAESYLNRVQAHREAVKVRSIDALLLRNWSGGRAGRERIAVEVKISRADFFRDTAVKRAPWQTLTHRFAYAVPAGLVTPAEVPDGCWLLEVDTTPCSCPRHAASPRRVHWNPAVRGERRRPRPLPADLVAHLARRAGEAEARLARPAALGADEVAAQLAELRRLRQQVSELRTQRELLRYRLSDLTRLVVEVTPQACADCGEQLVPKATRYRSYRWEHRRRAAEGACTQLRAARAAELEAAGVDAFELRYGGPEPVLVRESRRAGQDPEEGAAGAAGATLAG